MRRPDGAGDSDSRCRSRERQRGRYGRCRRAALSGGDHRSCRENTRNYRPVRPFRTADGCSEPLFPYGRLRQCFAARVARYEGDDAHGCVVQGRLAGLRLRRGSPPRNAQRSGFGHSGQTARRRAQCKSQSVARRADPGTGNARILFGPGQCGRIQICPRNLLDPGHAAAVRRGRHRHAGL